MNTEEVTKLIKDKDFDFVGYHKGLATFYSHVEVNTKLSVDIHVQIGYATYEDAYNLTFSNTEQFSAVDSYCMSSITVVNGKKELYSWTDDNY